MSRFGRTSLGLAAGLIVTVCPVLSCRPSSDGTAAGDGTAQRTAPVAVTPVSVGELDSLIRQAVAAEHLVGISVGVMQSGQIVLAKGYGVRDLSTRDPVTPTTLFAIGSVTKQFTCTAMLLLARERTLSPRDPVAKYLPQVTRARDITLLQLGQHVSGYRDYYPLDFVNREMQRAATADQIIQEYATRPLDFEPGTRWSYSNTNFLMLGRVIEMVSGKPFGAFLEERIFTPLMMAHTRYDPPRTMPGLASGYTSFALGPPVPALPEAQGWAGSAGAIWSTPTDLLAWDLALVDGKVLGPETYAMLTTPLRLPDGRSTGYGCGEGVADRGEAVVLSHGGAVAGFVARNSIVPATRSAVVVLANTDFGATGALGDAILAKLMPRVDLPAVSGLPALPAAQTFLEQLQRGIVDRATLGEEFAAYLTPELERAARTSLRSLGPVTQVRLLGTRERGGMEVASLRFTVGATSARALMYRTPDGKIQEFLIFRD